MNGRLLAGVLALLVLGCGPGSQAPLPTGDGYDLACGPMQTEDCVRWAADVAAAARNQHPGLRIVSISITSAAGSYELLFDDGTGISADIN